MARPRLEDEPSRAWAQLVEDVAEYRRHHRVSERVASELLGLPYGTFRRYRDRYRAVYGGLPNSGSFRAPGPSRAA